MHIVIGISIGTIIGIAMLVWLLFGVWRANARRRRLERLRAKQEATRLKAIEKAMRPPLWRRLRLPTCS
jgi:type VI protein secretion system component VasK